MNPRLIFKVTSKMILGAVLISGAPSGALAQSRDFSLNTQLSGQLAGSLSGCPTGATCSTGGPGFNPTDLVNHADPNATITGAPKIAGGTGPFFSRLGAGAITDNMFGVISKVHPGADLIFGNADDEPTRCGSLPGDPNTGPGVSPTSVGSNNSSLNCGDLRFDPASQGQTIPTFPAANSVQIDSKAGAFSSDFNPSTDDHLGFDLINDFNVSPATSGGSQQMKQVTALTAGGTAATIGSPGTSAAPGTGDQSLQINTSWSLTGTFDSATNRPSLAWTMSLKEVDPLTPNTAPFPTNQADSINTMGTLSITSSSAVPGSPNAFVYNSGLFPQMAIPNSCWWSGCAAPAESMTIP